MADGWGDVLGRPGDDYRYLAALWWEWATLPYLLCEWGRAWFDWYGYLHAEWQRAMELD